MIFEPFTSIETLDIAEQRMFCVFKLKLLILSIEKLMFVTVCAATVAGGFKGFGLLSFAEIVLSEASLTRILTCEEARAKGIVHE